MRLLNRGSRQIADWVLLVAEQMRARSGAHVRLGVVSNCHPRSVGRYRWTDVLWLTLSARLGLWPESVVGVKTRSGPSSRCALPAVSLVFRLGSRK